jgi:hypothetical protein
MVVFAVMFSGMSAFAGRTYTCQYICHGPGGAGTSETSIYAETDSEAQRLFARWLAKFNSQGHQCDVFNPCY